MIDHRTKLRHRLIVERDEIEVGRLRQRIADELDEHANSLWPHDALRHTRACCVAEPLRVTLAAFAPEGCTVELWPCDVLAIVPTDAQEAAPAAEPPSRPRGLLTDDEGSP